MKDVEARDRLDALEKKLEGMPARIVSALTSSLSDDTLRAQVAALGATLEGVVARLEGVEAAVKAGPDRELLEVVESELNALRVDANAQRAAIMDVAVQAGKANDRLSAMVRAIGQVPSSS